MHMPRVVNANRRWPFTIIASQLRMMEVLLLFTAVWCMRPWGVSAFQLQDGSGYSLANLSSTEPIMRSPLVMESYDNWQPGMWLGSLAFHAASFDGRYVWMAPYDATAIVRVDTAVAGSMTMFNDWPPGFTKSAAAFDCSVYDGAEGYLWLAPGAADSVIRVDTKPGKEGNMTRYNQWPAGFSLWSEAFNGCAFDGRFIWLAPFQSDSVIRVDTRIGSEGNMTRYNNWPAQLTAVSSAFVGAVYDGVKYMWLVPHNANGVVAVDTRPGREGNMSFFGSWPAGMTKGVAAFAGGTFDGRYVWLAPYQANFVVRVDTVAGSEGSMTGFSCPISSTAGSFSGGVFDGRYVWLLPCFSGSVVRVDTHPWYSGNMTLFNDWPSALLPLPAGVGHFIGGVFDGRSVWMVPWQARSVVRLSGATATPTVSFPPSSMSFTASSSGAEASKTTTLSDGSSGASLLSHSGTIGDTDVTNSHSTQTPHATAISVSTSFSTSLNGSDATQTLSPFTRSAPSQLPTASPSIELCQVDRCRLTADADVSSLEDMLLRITSASAAAPLLASALIGAEVATWIGVTPAATGNNGTVRLLRLGLHCGPGGSERAYSGSTVRVGVTALLSMSGVAGAVPLSVMPQSTEEALRVQQLAVARRNITLCLNEAASSTLQSDIQRAGGGLFWFATRRITLTLNVSCGVPEDSALRRWVPLSVTVPVTAIPLPAVSSAAVAIASQWAGALSSGTTAAAIGRMVASRQLALCSSASPSGGLLGLSIGEDPNGNDTATPRCNSLRLARGAVVGNAAVIAATFVGLLLLGCVCWAAIGVRPGARAAALYGLRRVCLPSSLLPLWAVTVSSTAGGVVALVISVDCGSSSFASDMTVAVVLGAMALLALPIVLLLALAVIGPARLFGVNLARPIATRQPAVFEWFARLQSRLWRWEGAALGPSRLHGGPPPWRVAQAVLLEYRLPWYCALDACVLVAASVASGLSGLFDARVCLGAGVATLAVYGVQLVVCCITQPFTTRLSYGHACVTLLLSVVSASLQLWYVAASNSAASSAPWQLTASSVCDVMLVAVSLAKSAVDMVAVMRAAHRLLLDMLHHHDELITDDDDDDDDDIALDDLTTVGNVNHESDRGPSSLMRLLDATWSSDVEGRDEGPPSCHHSLHPLDAGSRTLLMTTVYPPPSYASPLLDEPEEEELAGSTINSAIMDIAAPTHSSNTWSLHVVERRLSRRRRRGDGGRATSSDQRQRRPSTTMPLFM